MKIRATRNSNYRTVENNRQRAGTTVTSLLVFSISLLTACTSTGSRESSNGNLSATSSNSNRPRVDRGPQKSARITKIDGQVVEGEIYGVILLKGNVESSPMGFSVTYFPTNGKEIERIDDQGIHLEKGSASVALVFSDKEKLPNEMEILKAALSSPGGSSLGLVIDSSGELMVPTIRSGEVGISSFFAESVNDYTGFIMKHGGNRARSTDHIAGTARMENKEIRLDPAIEVITGQGVLTIIPLDQIIQFSSES